MGQKTLMKEVKDTAKWKVIPRSWTETVNTIINKTSVLPKRVYKFNVIPIKILKAFFIEVREKA